MTENPISTGAEWPAPNPAEIVRSAPPVPPVSAGRTATPIKAFVLLAILSLVVSLGSWAQQSSPYAALVPGPTFDVTQSISGEAVVENLSTHGPALLTTVEVRELTNLERLLTYLPGSSAQTVRRSSGDRTSAPSSGATQMEVSIRTAAFVALQVAGAPADSQFGQGALVVDVAENSPAERAGVKIGSVVVAVNQVPVLTDEDLVARLGAIGPGRTVRFSFKSGEELDLRIAMSGKAGVVIVTDLAEDLPINANIEGVGGASGGLLFTLAFIDALSPGDLFARAQIAGTGTISPSGAVGPIAGADLKVVAAHRDGANIFFAPTENAVAARAAAPAGIEVVEVANIQDALGWLCANGSEDEVCDQPER